MKDIAVFICEDEKVRKEIVEKYMFKGQITFASLFPADKREEITKALELI